MHAEKIVRIKPIGLIKTMDIEINNPKHIFYGNGIATSNSHAVAYAYNSYITAYAKAHYPMEFFTSYLQHSHSKPDYKEEIKELVNNMRVMEIPVSPPNLTLFNNSFELIADQITFGLTDIKGIGAANVAKIKEKIEDVKLFVGKRLNEWSWTDFLVFLSAKIDKTSVENLIGAGALDFLKTERTQMSHDYWVWSELKEREHLWIQNELLRNTNKTFTLSQLLEYLLNSPTGKAGGIYHKKRVSFVNSLKKIVDNPPYRIKDVPTSLSRTERELLGISLTTYKIDDYGLGQDTCRDIVTDSTGFFVNIVAEISNVREHKIKNGKAKGQTMAFLTLSDQTGEADSISVFSDSYTLYRDLLYKGNICLFCGKVGKKGIILDKITSLKV